METLWHELSGGIPDSTRLLVIVIRLLAAVILGAAIGFEREHAGKVAGVRTHILVALGSCVFVLAGAGYGMSPDGVSRVVQGIVTGIGFLGAGTIIKLSDLRDVKGLTTAAGIWMTAAVGVGCGAGTVGLAIIAAVVVLVIQFSIRSMETKYYSQHMPKDNGKV
jgi:putative Mg2+ transporter-C (MgtC) family protein